MSSSEHGPDETSAAPGPGSPPLRPTWVKVMGIVVALVLAAVVVMALAGGGEHGPGRHQPGGAPAGHTPPMQHNS